MGKESDGRGEKGEPSRYNNEDMDFTLLQAWRHIHEKRDPKKKEKRKKEQELLERG